LTSILFGDALGVTAGDIRVVAAVAVIALIATVVFYRPFLALSFNEQKAQLLGFRPRLAHALMLALMTLTIVASFQTVGTLLVFGLLVGPPATAALLARRLPTIMATAALIGILCVAAGLVVSFHADISGSATMAIMPIALFFVVLGVRAAVDRVRQRAVAQLDLSSDGAGHRSQADLAPRS
jgi:ABC-type Mn2+/Zn2+ transport system permease subunit